MRLDRSLLLLSTLTVACVTVVGAGPLVPSGSHSLLPVPPLAIAVKGYDSNNTTLCSQVDGYLVVLEYPQNASIIYSHLCVLPAFVNLVNQWGGWRLVPRWMNESGYVWTPVNLTFGSGGNLSVPFFLTFSVNFVTACDNASEPSWAVECSYNEGWLGNVSSNALTGPFIFEMPAMCSCGVVHSPTSNGVNGTPGADEVGVLILGSGVVVGGTLAMALAVIRRPRFR